MSALRVVRPTEAAVGCQRCGAKPNNPCVTPSGWGSKYLHQPRIGDARIAECIRADLWGMTADQRPNQTSVRHRIDVVFRQPHGGMYYAMCGNLVWKATEREVEKARECRRCAASVERVLPLMPEVYEPPTTYEHHRHGVIRTCTRSADTAEANDRDPWKWYYTEDHGSNLIRVVPCSWSHY